MPSASNWNELLAVLPHQREAGPADATPHQVTFAASVSSSSASIASPDARIGPRTIDTRLSASSQPMPKRCSLLAAPSHSWATFLPHADGSSGLPWSSSAASLSRLPSFQPTVEPALVPTKRTSSASCSDIWCSACASRSSSWTRRLTSTVKPLRSTPACTRGATASPRHNHHDPITNPNSITLRMTSIYTRAR